jgi:hypothetical protein
MKKSLSLVLVLVFIAMMASACSGPKPTYSIDFENANLTTYQTINFDEAMTPDGFKIGTEDGFKGNALNLKIIQADESNTWWTAGMSMSPDLTTEANFKDLKRITFDYKSTVEYKEVPFIVQIVWKDKTTGDEAGSITVDFPMEKTDKVKTFEFPIPADLTEKLNNATNYYLDWFMIGLADQAGDAFSTGKFSVDNINFYNK